MNSVDAVTGRTAFRAIGLDAIVLPIGDRDFSVRVQKGALVICEFATASVMDEVLAKAAGQLQLQLEVAVLGVDWTPGPDEVERRCDDALEVETWDWPSERNADRQIMVERSLRDISAALRAGKGTGSG